MKRTMILSSCAIFVLLCALSWSAMAQPETVAGGETQVDEAAPAATAPDAPVVAAEEGASVAPTEGDSAAAEEPTPPEQAEEDTLGTLEQLVNAVRYGQWRLAASLVLALLMLALAKARPHMPWFEGDRGGAILVGVLALAGAISTALATTAPLDWRLFAGALAVMWTAVGGVQWIKRIVWPKE